MSEKQASPRMLGAMLRIPFQAIVSRIDLGLQARGFTDLHPAHFVIFQQIDAQGSRITELAERAQITKQSMGALVDYVERRGYVQRVPDPGDGRAKIVRLTPRGRELEAAARQILSQIEDEWSQRIGPQRMQALKESLQAIIRVIEKE
jgi:DNA-binding MarR family transcriptional regulator